MSTPLLHGKVREPTLLDTKYLPFLVGTMALFIAIGGYGVYSVKLEIKSSLVNQLQLTLAANVESLRLFFEDKKLDAQVLADQPEIRKNILFLIQLNKKKDLPAKELRQSASLKWLREHLGKACKKYNFIGFIVFDFTGFQVGSLLEEPLGKRGLIERSVFFYQSLQGDTVVSNPFMAGVKLPNEQGEFLANQPTQFVSTPLKDQDGNVLGVLALRMRPHKEFDKMLTISRFGKTGETYVFNDNGLLVSKSRFNEQLVKIGLLPHTKASIFNIQIRDPDRDLRKKPLLSGESVENWPLTLMAENAVMKKAGVNVEGYNDYRGVPVIGAWTWMEDQMLGIATEVDTDEAFATLNTLLFWYLTLLGLHVISMIVGLFLRSRILKSRKQSLENQKSLISLTGIISDSVVAIDQKGIVQSINPAVEKVFGYSPKEVIGKNVKILMPEPYFSEHDGYLDNYLRTGEKKIINMLREIMGLHKNGSTFPMELSVSESIDNDKKIFVGVLRDISERKANELAMALANRERDLILNSAGEGIYGLDLEGKTTFVNQTACKILGYSVEELLRKGLHIMIHHSYADGTHYPKEKCHIYAAFKDGEVHYESEEVFWKKDGSSIPVEYISKPIIDGGKVVGAVVTFTDITARKSAEKELLQAYNELEKRIQERTHELNQAKKLAEHHNQAKSEFLSRMSHELRTPMNAILGFAQIMNESRKDPLSDSHKSRIGQILKAGNHLLELINEVLDLTQVEAGKTTVSLEPINIAELVMDVLNVIRPMAEKFNIDLIDEVSTQATVHIFADRTRLKQVLFNLLSNGIKYNRKEGSVTLSLEKQNDGILNILVSDTGMGISPEKLKKIFIPFNRLGAEGGEIEGTGIGMTISKKLIELMNGIIRVHSTMGKGSQFSISLPGCDPTTIENKMDDPHLEAPNPTNPKRKYTVLYIEDNKANVLLVKDIFSDYPKVDILAAPQAAMGLDLAHAHQPDLILLDINLPGMDGYEALKRLQHMEETHDIPVIALSANAMQKDIDRAIEAGFKDYITKPIDMAKFKKMLDEFVS
ncbi:MAG: PAS domain S-box-containing protein [Nitrospinales bacterium]|jgi:PAS domain S-box-containing protein